MEIPNRKEIVEEVKTEWKKMWRERIDDKVKAEGIANTTYNSLFVERGTIVFATRDFRPLNLKDILEQHKISDVYRIVPPDPAVGGWGRFIRKSISRQKPTVRTRWSRQYQTPLKNPQQLKKGGRGWLHF